VLAIAIAVPAAYALTRFAFLGRRLLAGTLLATQAVSGLLFLVPLVLLFGKADQWFGIHLLGSYTGLVLTSMTFALPVSVGLLSTYFAGLPPQVEESAQDLGAGPLTTLWLVVLPNARSAIATTAVFAFTLSWGEVLFASMLSDDDTRTLAVGLSGYASESGAHWNELMAASLLAAAPVVVLFLVVSRSLRTGLGGRPAGGDTGLNDR
jgi:multiple sugar transport system permease protein